MDLRLCHPFSMLVSGSRGAGKTEFTKCLIKERNSVVNETFDIIKWCYSKRQPKLEQELKIIFPTIEFVEGISEDVRFSRDKNSLVVLDDLMNDALESSYVSDLFTKGRHDNVSVILLTQNLFHQGKHSRDISINSDYLVLFKNPRDQSQITNLAKQMFPRNVSFFTGQFSRCYTRTAQSLIH